MDLHGNWKREGHAKESFEAWNMERKEKNKKHNVMCLRLLDTGGKID